MSDKLRSPRFLAASALVLLALYGLGAFVLMLALGALGVPTSFGHSVGGVAFTVCFVLVFWPLARR